jgi:DNA adenine methylase
MIGPLPYIGGKRRLAPRLGSLIPNHIAYVEPFAGGAQLFFHKPRSKVEVLNDLDGDVVNFLRICQRHPDELARLLRFQPISRFLFDLHNQQPAELLTDIERAARFFYLQKNCWSGKRTRQNLHFAVSKPCNWNPADLRRRLNQVAHRLQQTQLESSPYEDVLKRFDRPTTFFYCDPPYVGADLYKHNFRDEDFVALAARLAALKGRFLLSINDCAKARTWFRGFECRPITLTYTSLAQPRRFTELLFANYPLPDTLTQSHVVEAAIAQSNAPNDHVA